MGLRKIWVIAFFICAFRASAKAEESIQELINKATTPFTSETRNEAWRVLSSRGEEAASALLERYNKTEDSAIRELILDYFAMLGPKMKGEMPALLKALLEADEKLVRRFSRVFNSFDSKSKADLYAHLKDKNAFVRVRCADALISFARQKGSEDLKLAVPVLAEGMSTRETRVRREAAAGLKAAGMFAKNGEAGLLSKEGAVSLGKALKDEDPEMRRRVASILADFGTEA